MRLKFNIVEYHLIVTGYSLWKQNDLWMCLRVNNRFYLYIIIHSLLCSIKGILHDHG